MKLNQTMPSLSKIADVGLNDVSAHQNSGNMNRPTTTNGRHVAQSPVEKCSLHQNRTLNSLMKMLEVTSTKTNVNIEIVDA